MTKLLKPLFDIQRVYIDGKTFHYEIHYKHGNEYRKHVDACFFSLTGAQSFINELIESGGINENRH